MSRFSPAFLDEIRAKVPVSDVARQRVQLKKEGREWRGLSPFNSEKTPSFFVNDQKGFFHDFSSGKHGDAFAFLMETEGVSFPEAVERLAGMAGLELPKVSDEQQVEDKKRASVIEVMELACQFFEAALHGAGGARGRDYLVSREIGLAKDFRLGLAPAERFALRDHLAGKGVDKDMMIEAGLLIHGEEIAVPYDRFRDRLIFPITDRSGKVIAFTGRALSSDAKAKYLNSPETTLFVKGQNLYNHHRARAAAHEKGRLIAVEGNVDVIAMTQAGFPETVAPMGTALTPEQCELMWRISPELIFCFDGDAAGRKAAYRAIDTVLPMVRGDRLLQFIMMPAGVDPDDLLRKDGADAMGELVDRSQPLIEMLWRRETEGGRFDIPEQRAGLADRLRACVASIRDSGLRYEYGQDIKQRLYALSRAKKSAAPAPARALPKPSAQNYRTGPAAKPKEPEPSFDAFIASTRKRVGLA